MGVYILYIDIGNNTLREESKYMTYLANLMLANTYHRAYLNDKKQVQCATTTMAALQRENKQQSTALQNTYQANKSAIEAKYNSQISSLNNELAQAQADGDTTKATEIQKQIDALNQQKENDLNGLETLKNSTADQMTTAQTNQETYWNLYKENYQQLAETDRNAWQEAKQWAQEALQRLFPKQTTTTHTV